MNYIVSSIGEYRVRGEHYGLVGDGHGGGVLWEVIVGILFNGF